MRIHRNIISDKEVILWLTVSRFLMGSENLQSILWYESDQSFDHNVDKSKAREMPAALTSS